MLANHGRTSITPGQTYLRVRRGEKPAISAHPQNVIAEFYKVSILAGVETFLNCSETNGVAHRTAVERSWGNVWLRGPEGGERRCLSNPNNGVTKSHPRVEIFVFVGVRKRQEIARDGNIVVFRPPNLPEKIETDRHQRGRRAHAGAALQVLRWN